MALQPLQEEQVQQTAQVLLAVLSDERVTVPGNMLEGAVSGKSLLRGILQGQLVVCQRTQDGPPPQEGLPEDPLEEPKKAAPRKKRASKKSPAD